MNLDLIDKEQFIENFEGEFEGNDQKGYLYKGFFISTSEIYDATCRMVSDCGDLKELIEENNDDDIIELHNSIMAYLFGDGKNYQGSYKDTEENVDWYLDFGEIIIDEECKGFTYSNVSFYRSDRKSPRES